MIIYDYNSHTPMHTLTPTPTSFTPALLFQYITVGYYRQHIQKWVSTGISRSQILVLNFQTLTRNTTDRYH